MKTPFAYALGVKELSPLPPAYHKTFEASLVLEAHLVSVCKSPFEDVQNMMKHRLII